MGIIEPLWVLSISFVFCVDEYILCETSFDYSTRYNARQSAGESKERNEGL